MSPNETLFLESTNKIYKDDISNSSFVNFQIWDFPGQMDFFDPTFDYEMIFRGTGALIYVIDAQVVRNDTVYFSSLVTEDVGTKESCLFVMCFLQLISWPVDSLTVQEMYLQRCFGNRHAIVQVQNIR